MAFVALRRHLFFLNGSFFVWTPSSCVVIRRPYSTVEEKSVCDCGKSVGQTTRKAGAQAWLGP